MIIVPFSIYSSAIKYNKSFIETQRLVSDKQSKFKKNQQQTKASKIIYVFLCIFQLENKGLELVLHESLNN